MADGKYQQALDKISSIDNEELYGKIGLRKAGLYYWLKDYKAAIRITKKLIPYFETVKKYNEYDRIYLLFCTKLYKMRCFREMGIKHSK